MEFDAGVGTVVMNLHTYLVPQTIKGIYFVSQKIFFHHLSLSLFLQSILDGDGGVHGSKYLNFLFEI